MSRIYHSNQLELDFPDWTSTVSSRYGKGDEHEIIVPSSLQLNTGMFMPDVINRMQELEVFLGEIPKNIDGFHKVRADYNRGIIRDVCPHFYLYDNMFACILNNPIVYTAMLKSYNYVISPDCSVYMLWTEHDKRQSIWRNQTIAKLWQINGINVIVNVSWAGPNSYGYCTDNIPKHSIIAINCSGIKGDADATYFWHKGYEYVLKVLEPTHILRYGDIMEGEYKEISTYYTNPIIARLHNGR